MDQAVVVFVSQFVFVMLKGTQQINVVRGRVLASAVVSFVLGVCGLLTLDILTTSFVHGAHWTVFAAFLVSGPAGIVAAIKGESLWKGNSTS